MHRLSLPVAVILAVVGAGCGSNSTPTTPSAPSATPPPSPPVPGPGSGTIVIREVSPSPGATLIVRACPSGAVTRPCADQWRSTIDVQVNREMPYAVLVAQFYDGATRCGNSAYVMDVLPADRPVTFNLSSIWWSDESSSPPQTPCPLPTRITRMEVALWSDSSSWTNTLMTGFPAAYTLVSQ